LEERKNDFNYSHILILNQYLINLNFINILEFVFQIFIIYNIVSLIKQTKFYYLFSYFILIIIYIGLFLIVYNLDLNTVIL